MAKPIEFVVEIENQKDARQFLEDILAPKANPKREAILQQARKMKIIGL